jgi:hypothetical protein
MDAAVLHKAKATPVHTAMIEVLSDLLQMGNAFSSDKVPAPLRAMMRTLDMMKPTLVEELSQVPPEQITAFMAGLRDRLDTIVVAGVDPGSQTPALESTAQTG